MKKLDIKNNGKYKNMWKYNNILVNEQLVIKNNAMENILEKIKRQMS
jgi:hypothetical protein